MPIELIQISPCIQRMSDPQWKFARAAIPQVRGIVVTLTDEKGCNGFGYAPASPFTGGTLDTVSKVLECFMPALQGGDPLRRADLLAKAHARLPGHPNELGALDMALHDLASRRLGIPLHALLGGRRRDSIEISRLISLKSPEDMAQIARSLSAEGFRALKVKLSGEPTIDVDRIAAVRSAVGPSVTLTVDANEAYSAKVLMSVFHRMEPYGISLIEQPVRAGDWAGLKLLTDNLPTAIEADESAQSLVDIARLVGEHVVDSINLRIGRLGSIAEFQTATRICALGGVSIRIGTVFGPSLVPATIAQVASTVDRLEFACELGEHLHFLDDPFSPLPIEDGKLTISDAPGTGVEHRG
jgi:L-Ala-D/L-Glu epimerase